MMSEPGAAAQSDGPRGPVDRTRALAATIADAAGEQRRFRQALLECLHEARLFRLLMPASVDGEEVAPLDADALMPVAED